MRAIQFAADVLIWVLFRLNGCAAGKWSDRTF